MAALRLSAVADIVPQRRPTLFELGERYERSGMGLAQLTVFHRIYGLDKVPVWDSSIEDLVEQTVATLLKESDADPEHVSWLIHAHTGAQHNAVGHGILTRVCARLGLSRARVFGMTANNCASTVSAIQVVERLLARGGPGEQAIVVTADVAFTPILQVIPNSSVTGDAAAACLLSTDRVGHRVLATQVDTYGRHARCQWQDEAENHEFEENYPRRTALAMRRALDKAGLGWDDVKVVLPHNINTFSWKRVAAEAGIPLGLVYLDQVSETAHCFGADLFLNFAVAERSGMFADGDRILMATVGLGAVFAAVVLEYREAS